MSRTTELDPKAAPAAAEGGTMSRTTELDPKAAPAAALIAGGEAAVDPGDEAGVEEELLIEEISIDGMCGVY